MDTTIVSDRIADAVVKHGIEQQLPDGTSVKKWEEFSPNSIIADHLVLDLNFVHLVEGKEFSDIPVNRFIGGENREMGVIENKEDILIDTLKKLEQSDVLSYFLSSGGSLTVLYSDMLKVETESGRTTTHHWLYKAGMLARTIPVMDAKFMDPAVDEFEVVTDSDVIDEYFKFVKGYTHFLEFEPRERDIHYKLVNEDPEILAESEEGSPIAARVNQFEDASGEVQELDSGSITFLPQPTRLNPRPQDLVESLAAIGFEEDGVVEPVAYGLPSGSSDLPDLVSEDIERALKRSEHGEEVLKQIEDGDACIENDLWQPALGSYVHAIEWAFIAYLEAEQGLDVVEKEQQGGVYYNLAGGHHSLLDEVKKHADLDQKTVDSITSMNQAQRRWMAHHKSRETLGHDVMSLRSRLGTVLEELFD